MAKYNPYKRKTWVTKENIKRWREGAERYAQENYDLRHRGSFIIKKIGAFSDIWLKQDYSKITSVNKPVEKSWYSDTKYILWAHDFRHLLKNNERPTKEHYIFIDSNFNIIRESGINQSSFKIPNGQIKKMINEGIIGSQTTTDILETKILLVSGE